MTSRRDMIPQGAKPPCNCRPTNVNNLAPEKGYNSLGISRPAHDLPVRPPAPGTVSLGIAAPNLFAYSLPKINLNWQSSSNSSDPKKQRTPRKSPDRKGYK